MKKNLLTKLSICGAFVFTLATGVLFSQSNEANRVNAAEPTVHNTEVSDARKNVYDKTWFRFTLTGYPDQTQGNKFKDADTNLSVSLYSSFNFLENIYVNNDESQNFFLSDISKVRLVYNIQGDSCIAFHTSIMSTAVDQIKSITIKAGTKFPYLKSDKSAPSDTDIYVTTEDVILYDAGNDTYQKKDDVDSPITFIDYGGSLSSFNGDWTTGSATPKASFNLMALPNRTLDVAFDWKVSGASGSDSIKLKTSEKDGLDQGPWFYRNSDGNVQYAEVNASPNYDYNIKKNINVGDVIRIHYVREYNADFTKYTAYVYVDGYKINPFGLACNVKESHIDTTGNNALYIDNIKTGGAVRSAFADNYTSKNYNINISYNGNVLPVTVLGGTTLKTLLSMPEVQTFLSGVDFPIVTNDLGFELPLNSLIHRDVTLEVKNDTRPVATFTKINEYNNNVNIKDKEGYLRTYLEFDKKPTTSSKSDNIANGNAFLNGVDLNTYPNFEMNCRDTGGNFVLIDLPKSALVATEEYPYVVFHSNAGISAYDVILGEVNLVLDEEGKWQPCGQIHKVVINDQTLYIPHGFTLPEKDLSKYCSATFEDEEHNPIDIKSPIVKDMKIIAHYVEHDLEHHEAKERSCLVDGNLEYWSCKNEGCGKVFIKDGKGNYILSSLEDVILPAGHKEESVNKVPGKEATCTVPGYKDAWYCNDCENYYADSELLVLIGNEAAYEAWKLGAGKIVNGKHHMIKTAEVKATCSTFGNKAYWYCDECEVYYADENGAKIIGDATALALWIIDENGGLLPLDPNNHIHGLAHHSAQASTCTVKGHIEYWSCDDCDQLYADEEGTKPISGSEIDLPIDANNHELVYVKEVAATYEAEGVKAHYECSLCHKLFVKDSSGKMVEVTKDQLVIKKLTKGCKGSIETTSIVLSALALAGLSLFLIRKRKLKY